MDISTQIKIRNNPYIYRYLRENSYWYKELNRHPESIRQLEEEVKSAYKMNTSDKIDRLNQRIEMIRTFMEILN